jgi:hypothetical protein
MMKKLLITITFITAFLSLSVAFAENEANVSVSVKGNTTAGGASGSMTGLAAKVAGAKVEGSAKANVVTVDQKGDGNKASVSLDVKGNTQAVGDAKANVVEIKQNSKK